MRCMHQILCVVCVCVCVCVRAFAYMRMVSVCHMDCYITLDTSLSNTTWQREQSNFVELLIQDILMIWTQVQPNTSWTQ